MPAIGDATTRMPHARHGHAVDLSSTPVLLQGQRVMFDHEVALTPARVERIEPERDDERDRRHR